MRANAKQKITVELSNADRQLLRDIRDALLEPDEVKQKRRDDKKQDAKQRRLVETPQLNFGNPASVRDNYLAESEGYTWDGTGWVPKG